MDAQEYMQSGALEAYSLGLLNEEEQSFLFQMALLYPEVKAELNEVERALEVLSLAAAVEPARDMKADILTTLGFTGSDKLDLNKLPATHKNADHELWLEALSHLIPAEPAEDFICEVIREDDRFQQMLVITKNDVPDEQHGDYLESFFILKGQCECTVGTDFFTLNAGDYLEIPLHVKHNIKITSPNVVAILQYQFV